MVKSCLRPEHLFWHGGPAQPVDWNRTSPVTESHWLSARSSPCSRQYPPVLDGGGGWWRGVRMTAGTHKHTSKLVVLRSNRQSVAPPFLSPPPHSVSSSSPNVCQQAPALVFGSLCWTPMFESKLRDEDQNRGFEMRGELTSGQKLHWWLVDVCSKDTPGWIPATPPQMCPRLKGWGEGVEGVPRGPYSLVTAKRLLLPGGCYDNPFWFQQQCKSTTSPILLHLPFLSYTFTCTHSCANLQRRPTWLANYIRDLVYKAGWPFPCGLKNLKRCVLVDLNLVITQLTHPEGHY